MASEPVTLADEATVGEAPQRPLALVQPAARAGLDPAPVRDDAPSVGAVHRAAAAVARRLGRRGRHGQLRVEGVGGGWQAGEGSPSVRVTVHDGRTYWAVLRHGSEGLAESYIARWWDCDDLTGLTQLLLLNLATPIDVLDRIGERSSGALSWWQRRRPPTAAADQANVRAHYDLPPRLFDLMLDETMSYSCAVFDGPEIKLADAQRAKLDRLCAKLGLGADDHLLEIGTGWGGLAMHAAGNYGCRVTTTTISAEQRGAAIERVAAAGLDDRIEVLGLDYRQLTGTYDKLVSVEMIEAVDWRLHDEFFATCRRLLKDDGLMALQAITIADRSYERAKHHDDFIRRMIFPGGCLPSVTAIAESVKRASDLRIVDLDDIGRHYATTLRRWYENFNEHWDEIAADGFDEQFHRLWDLYLCYCEGAFLERHISDVQIVLAAPRWRGPLAARGA